MPSGIFERCGVRRTRFAPLLVDLTKVIGFEKLTDSTDFVRQPLEDGLIVQLASKDLITEEEWRETTAPLDDRLKIPTVHGRHNHGELSALQGGTRGPSTSQTAASHENESFKLESLSDKPRRHFDLERLSRETDKLRISPSSPCLFGFCMRTREQGATDERLRIDAN
jgi:hypothetical protein